MSHHYLRRIKLSIYAFPTPSTQSEQEWGGTEYDFNWHDIKHSIDDPKEEEERRQKWAEQEKELLENAVIHEERKFLNKSLKIVLKIVSIKTCMGIHSYF